MKYLLPLTLLLASCLEEGAIRVEAVVCEEVLCGGYCAATEMGGQCFSECVGFFRGEQCAEEWTEYTACTNERMSVVLCAALFQEFDECLAATISGDGGSDASSDE